MDALYLTAKNLLLPPGILVLLLALGLLMLFRFRRTGRALIAVVLVTFYALSTPAVAGRLASSLIAHEPLPSPVPAGLCQAIVVLGGGLYHPAPEFGRESFMSDSTLWRVTYAAQVARDTGAPLLVSGGRPMRTETSEAEAMREHLEQRLGQEVRWVDDQGRTTAEQAVEVAALLNAEAIGRICLVTHATHMARAEAAFVAEGLTVVPAPTDFRWAAQSTHRLPWLPQAYAFGMSMAALQEHIGSLVYNLRRWLAV